LVFADNFDILKNRRGSAFAPPGKRNIWQRACEKREYFLEWEDGCKIIEIGSFDELINLKGTFYNLWNNQHSGS